MRYPHVVGLAYLLKAEDWAEFSDPPPVEVCTNSFFIRLDNDLITVWMQEHHSTSNSAREKVEEYLRRWEILSALQGSRRPLMRFECIRVEILDLEDPFSFTRTKPVGSSVNIGGNRVHRERRYPDPPEDFALSTEVKVMWTLYDNYLQGRERLLPMAYTCFTWIKRHPGGLKAAAKRYRVSKNVLEQLSKLSSRSGKGVEARKIDNDERRQDLTLEERRWVEAAIRALILRAGQYAADPKKAWPQITNSDLPPL
jgi:hypothetical protein